VITDGQDNMSRDTLQEATRQLQKANSPTIYAVGLLGSGMEKSGRDALQRLADGTDEWPLSRGAGSGEQHHACHRSRHSQPIHRRLQAAKPERPAVLSVSSGGGACSRNGPPTVRTMNGSYPGENYPIGQTQSQTSSV
jgi:hypothetical protein